MKQITLFLLAASLWVLGEPCLADAPAFLVEEGRPKAEIVIAEDPPRMVQLAVEELQEHIEKITGAKLSVVTEVTDEFPVKIYLGRSRYTDKLGIDDDGLEHGAYRIVSGPDYLVLLGGDSDFEIPESWPAARNHGDRERALEQWDEMTESRTELGWGNPVGSLFRQHNGATDTWIYDEGGSLNAVYGFLRGLGVRWYMPGEIGEVIPEKASIPVPEIDETVHPDVPGRVLRLGNYRRWSRDDVLWGRRLGLNNFDVSGTGGAHGLINVHGREAMQQAHPEYYALRGGRRETEFRGTGHACFSSEGLEEETVNYARAVFDLLDWPGVNIMPQDGLRQCECEVCVELEVSDFVFLFLDRVARQLYESHPDRLVVAGAYSSYRHPPESVETFSPNVAIRLSYHRPGLMNPEAWDQYQTLVDGWKEKLAPGRISRNANNYYSNGVIFPRAIARELGYLGSDMIGELSSVRRTGGGPYWEAPGNTHLNHYVISQYLWDNSQDIDELLDEYYELFYGPAAPEMETAIEFAEASLNVPGGKRRMDRSTMIEFVELLQTARNAAGDNRYGDRIQIIIDEFQPIEEMRQALAEEALFWERRAEEAVPAAGVQAGAGVEPETFLLQDNVIEGDDSGLKTTFTVTWEEDAIVFDIWCEEPDMENLFVLHNVWGGDNVAILLETPAHSYYQIQVNPDGQVFDADREAGINDNWDSQAEVETGRGDDFWQVTVRIPVVDEAIGAMDPLHNVVGEKPSIEEPWFFNVGRVRERDFNRSSFLFVPTETNFHVREKFGRLQID